MVKGEGGEKSSKSDRAEPLYDTSLSLRERWSSGLCAFDCNIPFIERHGRQKGTAQGADGLDSAQKSKPLSCQ